VKLATAAQRDAHGDVIGIIGGAGILLIQASALLPGLLPCLLIASVPLVLLAFPVVVIGALAAILVGLPIGLWKLTRRLLAAAG
jgi:hypothetical protein